MTIPLSRVFITAMGMISAVGRNAEETRAALCQGRPRFSPLSLFDAGPDGPLPVAEISGLMPDDTLPRTHQLVRIAADQAMARWEGPVDAIVIGSTTGGMGATEIALKNGSANPSDYVRHGVGTLAADLARQYDCTGPVITISTACASGAAAIAVAAWMIRHRMARHVLVGGVDALCQLTFFGFRSLKIIDPEGARPLDADRQGMTLGEGAAMLVLSHQPKAPSDVEILGAGLSCDAWHPSAPHPEGKGALSAMRAALADAGLASSEIDYINLHGTGTVDNDHAEALAVNALFNAALPPVSSTKGMTGHPLGASGALEAAFSAMAIEHGVIPANTGLSTVDPALSLSPITAPMLRPVNTVLSNALGFGGNNVALVMGRRKNQSALSYAADAPASSPAPVLVATRYACISGKGHTDETLRALSAHTACQGCLADATVRARLSPSVHRRLKRLSAIVLALSETLRETAAPLDLPWAISMGTGWGCLSETHDFLSRLWESDCRFPSPTDFIGSVHNAPAGQAALYLGATGGNITTTGGDYSFEQALLSASLMARTSPAPILVMGADEAHAALSPLFDPSVAGSDALSDGGGAILLTPGGSADGIGIALAAYHAGHMPDAISSLVDRVGGPDAVNPSFGAVLVNIPGGFRSMADTQMKEFLSRTGFSGTMMDIRQLVGEFATATAIAAVAAVHWVKNDICPACERGGAPLALDGKGILVLGLGDFVTAITVRPPRA
ncbi:beta-ketoacyl synthase chain length factor [Desulfosarcina sp. OttesenSCG-928-G10]|nr:beta-ketoacyl synthase chain length factor [Desulfosarcina sp. OttesenSCG-928-G10]